MTVSKIERPLRRFLSEPFLVTSWEALKPFFDDLLERMMLHWHTLNLVH